MGYRKVAPSGGPGGRGRSLALLKGKLKPHSRTRTPVQEHSFLSSSPNSQHTHSSPFEEQVRGDPFDNIESPAKQTGLLDRLRQETGSSSRKRKRTLDSIDAEADAQILREARSARKIALSPAPAPFREQRTDDDTRTQTNPAGISAYEAVKRRQTRSQVEDASQGLSAMTIRAQSLEPGEPFLNTRTTRAMLAAEITAKHLGGQRDQHIVEQAMVQTSGSGSKAGQQSQKALRIMQSLQRTDSPSDSHNDGEGGEEDSSSSDDDEESEDVKAADQTTTHTANGESASKARGAGLLHSRPNSLNESSEQPHITMAEYVDGDSETHGSKASDQQEAPSAGDVADVEKLAQQNAEEDEVEQKESKAMHAEAPVGSPDGATAVGVQIEGSLPDGMELLPDNVDQEADDQVEEEPIYHSPAKISPVKQRKSRRILDQQSKGEGQLNEMNEADGKDIEPVHNRNAEKTRNGNAGSQKAVVSERDQQPSQKNDENEEKEDDNSEEEDVDESLKDDDLENLPTIPLYGQQASLIAVFKAVRDYRTNEGRYQYYRVPEKASSPKTPPLSHTNALTKDCKELISMLRAYKRGKDINPKAIGKLEQLEKDLRDLDPSRYRGAKRAEFVTHVYVFVFPYLVDVLQALLGYVAHVAQLNGQKDLDEDELTCIYNLGASIVYLGTTVQNWKVKPADGVTKGIQNGIIAKLKQPLQNLNRQISFMAKQREARADRAAAALRNQQVRERELEQLRRDMIYQSKINRATDLLVWRMQAEPDSRIRPLRHGEEQNFRGDRADLRNTDANGEDFERLTMFGGRSGANHVDIPHYEVRAGESQWSDEERYVLMEALQDYSGPNTWSHIFRRECAPGCVLRDRTMSELLRQAKYMRDTFILFNEEAGEETEDWILQIPDLDIVPML